MNIAQAGCSDLGGVPRVIVPDDGWDFCDYVKVRVCTNLTQGAWCYGVRHRFPRRVMHSSYGEVPVGRSPVA